MIVGFLKTMRPKQWAKNSFIFAGLIFSGKIFDKDLVIIDVYAFIFFSFLASTIYIINDIVDKENDKKHPEKSKRPLASGALSSRVAITGVVIIGVLLLVSSLYFNSYFRITAIVYFFLFLAYSLFLKNIVIIDVFVLSFAYLLRVIAGATAISVEISQWLMLCTILLALFIGICKRRHELLLLTSSANEHRKILEEYSPQLLDQMISVVTPSTIIAYSLYAITSKTAHNSKYLMLTIPFVLYGIFRYLLLIYKKDGGGSPTALIFSDKPTLLNMSFWIIAVFIAIY